MRSVTATVCLLFLAGCTGAGDAPDLAPAKGTVTFKDAPVKGATVVFQGEKGQIGTGVTNDQGQFSINTGGREGAPIGQCKVSVTAATAAGSMPNPAGAPKSKEEFDAQMKKMQDDRQKQGRDKTETSTDDQLPAKYAKPETSGLTADVSADGAKNNFTFPLTP